MTQHTIDPDAPEFENAPKALRDALKAANKALEAERAKVTTLSRKAVGSVLAGQGFKNPKRVEQDLLADGIDPLDNEAVESWLSENGDDYAKGSASSQAEPDPVQQQAAAAHNAIQNVANDSTAAEAQTRLERALAEITPEMDGTKVDAIYRKHGL